MQWNEWMKIWNKKKILDATPEYTVAIRRHFREPIPIESREKRYDGYVSPTNVEVIDIKPPDILIIYNYYHCHSFHILPG